MTPGTSKTIVPFPAVTPSAGVVEAAQGEQLIGRQPYLPLTTEQMQGIETVGQRLRGELGRLVGWLPPDAKSVRTMAQFLGVDRNTCQRVIAALHPGASGCEAIARIPGGRSLQEFVRRSRSKGAPRDVIAGLTAAIEHLNGLLNEVGDSHARIKSRIESTLLAGRRSDRTDLDFRRSLFDDTARLLGRQLRVHSMVTAIRPHPEDRTKVEQAWIRGLIGLRMRPDSSPVPLGISSTDRQLSECSATAVISPLSQPASPEGPAGGLVESFSSSPAPTLTMRGPQGALVTVLDPASARGNQPIDAVVAMRISHVEHPTQRAPEVYHTSVVMLTPTERLIFDVYLHRSLALASVPSAGAFQYTMSFSDDPRENWPFRLPGQHRLELLGGGLDHAANPAWQRHGEAARYLFDKTGWAADDYVGHRLDVVFPLWGATYYQWFDFRQSRD